MLTSEDVIGKKKYDKRGNNQGNKRAQGGVDNKQRRAAKFLSNTHVISTGPLAAGNFIGGDKGSDRRGFVKMEGSGSSLVRKGLESIENDAGDSESDDNVNMDKDYKEDDDGKKESKTKTRFNMGREYTTHNTTEDIEVISDDDGDMDDSALQAKRIEQLFPVRPVRVRHGDVEQAKSELKESLSDAPTREATPTVPEIKIEQSAFGDGTELQRRLTEKDTKLQDRLDVLRLQDDFQSIDEKEVAEELTVLSNDYKHILQKLQRINDKPNRFMLFQLPTKLPQFEMTRIKKKESEDTNDMALDAEDITEKDTTKQAKKPKKKDTKQKGKKSKEIQDTPQDELIGDLGSIRVHKSGKITMKIGNTIMDVGRGAESTFLQDVVSLNASDEQPSVELLGRIEGKVVVTPRFP